MIQDFVQAVNDAAKRCMGAMHTAVPGKILKFDARTGRADVLPVAVYRMPDGTKLEYPKITDVPVMFPSGGEVGIYFPVHEGDHCLIVFSEKSIEYWMTGQDTETELNFDLSNAICIPGLFREMNKTIGQAFADNALILESGGNRILMSDQKIEISAPVVKISGKLEADGVVGSTLESAEEVAF